MNNADGVCNALDAQRRLAIRPSSWQAAIDGHHFVPPDLRTGKMTHRLTLVPAIGRKAQELPLHRIDPSEIARDEVIAAALAGHHLKITACECCSGTGAAEVDEGSEILFLLRACRHFRCAGENRRDIAVQIHGSQLDGMAGDRADIEAGEPAAGIHDRIPSDTEPRGLGVGRIGHLVEANGAGGGLVDSERIHA